MGITLSLMCDELEEEDLQALTVQLAKTLNEETNVAASLSETSGTTGQRGVEIAVGQIILTAFTSGAVVALLDVVKTIVGRKSTLRVKIQRGDGKSFEIRAENLTKPHIQETMNLASDFLGDAS